MFWIERFNHVGSCLRWRAIGNHLPSCHIVIFYYHLLGLLGLRRIPLQVELFLLNCLAFLSHAYCLFCLGCPILRWFESFYKVVEYLRHGQHVPGFLSKWTRLTLARLLLTHASYNTSSRRSHMDEARTHFETLKSLDVAHLEYYQHQLSMLTLEEVGL